MKDKYIEEKLKEFDKEFRIRSPHDWHEINSDDVKQFLKVTIKQTRLDTIKEIEGVVVGERAENNGMTMETADYRAGYNWKQREIIEALTKLKE